MLLLVRHGLTAANAAGLLLGRADPPLSPAGVAQARALAATLDDVAMVVTSPLTRARQTAAEIARAAGVPAVVDERWVELDYGEFDGKAASEIGPSTWDAWRADPAWVPPGGESLVALGRRVREACDELAVSAAEGTVVVVAHVSPIKAAVAWAIGSGDEVAWRLYVAPASITRVVCRDDRPPVLGSFNETAHLPGTPS
ncbi:MAG: histidine phosphatase family protein [Acidimicrobiales bacterium]